MATVLKYPLSQKLPSAGMDSDPGGKIRQPLEGNSANSLSNKSLSFPKEKIQEVPRMQNQLTSPPRFVAEACSDRNPFWFEWVDGATGQHFTGDRDSSCSGRFPGPVSMVSTRQSALS